ncbi:hypothetical protein IQ235_09655 [Oscillatoriales cyanobacterium LEGE 11467]|uniref:Pepco domain-containing protein n=1 Tax=Zarconia navalis LEGE 11467 TaxID=1828826 RepID=A0A928VXE5_9CYAN|nr:hypothetical protein [Zarconia navalis]MBE9041043.1 hypothetical protein [Zarconia navalis LEGE 11467]
MEKRLNCQETILKPMPEETIRIITYHSPEAETETEAASEPEPKSISIDGQKNPGVGATFLDIEVPEETTNHSPNGTVEGQATISEVPVATLELEMERLLDMVQRLVSRSPGRQQSGMQLEEIELSVEIDGRGKVSLVGSGLEMGSKGAVKLKFKRKP